MGHIQLGFARQVPIKKCVGRQEATAGHHACR